MPTRPTITFTFHPRLLVTPDCLPLETALCHRPRLVSSTADRSVGSQSHSDQLRSRPQPNSTDLLYATPYQSCVLPRSEKLVKSSGLVFKLAGLAYWRTCHISATGTSVRRPSASIGFTFLDISRLFFHNVSSTGPECYEKVSRLSNNSK